MYAINCVFGVASEERREIHESDSMHPADVVIQRSTPHVIESNRSVAGWNHPRSGVRGIVGIESGDDYLNAFCVGRGRHTLQVITGVAGIALKKIIPSSHDNDGSWRRHGSASQRESCVTIQPVTYAVS